MCCMRAGRCVRAQRALTAHRGRGARARTPLSLSPRRAPRRAPARGGRCVAGRGARGLSLYNYTYILLDALRTAVCHTGLPARETAISS